MQIKFILTIAQLLIAISSFGQNDSTWSKWKLLLGEWKLKGGQQETLSFILKPNNKIIEIRSNVFLPQPPPIHIDKLMIIYLDSVRSPSQAMFFDSDGQASNYSVTYLGTSIILKNLVKQAILGHKYNYRLTYTYINNFTIESKLETSKDNAEFRLTSIKNLQKIN